MHSVIINSQPDEEFFNPDPPNGATKPTLVEPQGVSEKEEKKSAASDSDPFRDEFIEGSGIDEELYKAAIEIIPDLEFDPVTKDVLGYPINEALNWKDPSRFGQQANPNNLAAVFRQEDGSIWQLKLQTPISQGRKYETPVGAGSRAFLPPISPSIRVKIGKRYNCQVPMDGSFWEWVAENPQLRIVWTEGGKKALSLMSEGIIAIALNGVNGGYCAEIPEKNQPRQLREDVLRFSQQGREAILAFDQDTKPSTVRRVQKALWTFSQLLRDVLVDVKVAQWEDKDGKGIDDLKKKKGAEVVEQCLNEAMLIALPRPQVSQIVASNLYSRGDFISFNGKLYGWKGTYYKELEDALELRRIQAFLDDFAIYDEKKKQSVYAYADPTSARTALQWVKGKFAVSTDAINLDGVINFKNCVVTLDWSSGIPQPIAERHDPKKHFLLEEPGVNYDPNADPAHCNALLDALSDDQQDLFLRVAGSSLHLEKVRQVRGRDVRSLLMKGDGSNGKDAIRKALSLVLGKRGMTGVTLGDFRQYDAGRKFPLARLEHSKINWATENASWVDIDRLQCLKAAITGDTIAIEGKGLPEFDLEPQTVFFFNINEMPRMSGVMEAIRSRYAILTFDKVFVSDPDPDKGELQADARFKYDDQWVRENVCPALFNRLVKGLQDAVRTGINYTSTLDAMDAIRQTQSHLWQFARDVGLTYVEGRQLYAQDIFAKLETWYIKDGTLEIQEDGRNVKRIWNDRADPKDKLCKASNQVIDRMLQVFPRAKKGHDSKKNLTVIVGLGFVNPGQSGATGAVDLGQESLSDKDPGPPGQFSEILEGKKAKSPDPFPERADSTHTHIKKEEHCPGRPEPLLDEENCPESTAPAAPKNGRLPGTAPETALVKQTDFLPISIPVVIFSDSKQAPSCRTWKAIGFDPRMRQVKLKNNSSIEEIADLSSLVAITGNAGLTEKIAEAISPDKQPRKRPSAA